MLSFEAGTFDGLLRKRVFDACTAEAVSRYRMRMGMRIETIDRHRRDTCCSFLRRRWRSQTTILPPTTPLSRPCPPCRSATPRLRHIKNNKDAPALIHAACSGSGSWAPCGVSPTTRQSNTFSHSHRPTLAPGVVRPATRAPGYFPLPI